jgi:hypothetical protein
LYVEFVCPHSTIRLLRIRSKSNYELHVLIQMANLFYFIIHIDSGEEGNEGLKWILRIIL